MIDDPKNVQISYRIELFGCGYLHERKTSNYHRTDQLCYVGDLRLTRVVIHNEVVNGLKLIEVLAKLAVVVSAATSHNTGPVFINEANINSVFIDGVAIAVIEERIEAMILDAINDSLQEVPKPMVDVKNALGLS